MAESIYTTFCGTGELRLLKLQASGADSLSPISCKMMIATFDESPVYKALSYVWGSQDQLSNIIIDDRVVVIGQNLYQALADLRMPSAEMVLWVDALCIDQEDDLEKFLQIQQMDLVYSKAASVIAYLGQPSFVKPPADENHGERVWNYVRERLPITTEHLLINPYWTRLWIVQEIGLAAEVRIQIGRESIPWDNFIPRMHYMLDWTHGSRLPDTVVQARTRIDDLVKIRITRKGIEGKLENLIERFQDKACLNKVDKIYGLMGLANDYNNRSTKQGPAEYGGYSKSSSKVYSETLEHFWLQRHTTFSKGVDRQYDRSMRIMRYSQLLLKILQEEGGFEDSQSLRYPNIALQVVARSMFIGTVTKVLENCKELQDLNSYYSRNKSTKSLSYSKWHVLKQNIERLTAEDFENTKQQLAVSAQSTSAAILEQDCWLDKTSDWERVDNVGVKLRRLVDNRKDATSLLMKTQSNQLFQVGDFQLLGIGPYGIRVGDLICKFWNMRFPTFVLLRRDEHSKGEVLRVIGKVKMLAEGNPALTWSSGVVAICMGVELVQYLSR